jgi:DNA-binding transcriptional MerR regulator
MTIQEVAKKYNLSEDTLRYYEKAGMIPFVHRTPAGIRDYQAEDTGWVELVACLRSAGLSVEAVAAYTKLYQQGEKTIPDRLKLLQEQKSILLEQKASLEKALDRLNYKIARYEIAVETGNFLSRNPKKENKNGILQTQ